MTKPVLSKNAPWPEPTRRSRSEGHREDVELEQTEGLHGWGYDVLFWVAVIALLLTCCVEFR